ncbi:MAG TPA: glycosyltransferase family 1 protein [Gemmatimonadaceae bacterium]|nr:glycosyltransferase family 1 protein [Gemmatimonadaceae bacterium]
MKRIGIILGSTPGGGIFQYTQAVLDAFLRFPEDEFELIIAHSNPVWLKYVPRDRRVIELENAFRSRVLNRVWHAARLPMGLWRMVAPAIDRNVAALVREKCDLWICPSNDSWAFRGAVPALGTVHDLMHIHEPDFPEVGSNEEIAEREFHFRETCRWAKGIAVDSEVGRQQLCDAYDTAPQRVFVLPYIAPRYIYESHRSGAATPGYDLPSKYFFYPATFWLHKNHAGLFAAMDRLRERHPDVRLVLAGSRQNGYDAAVKRVEELGLGEHVIFLGYVPEEHMYALYSEARALIMPSFFGPTNIPQLEAFVAGCPVAVANVYGVKDQVGNAALLFDPRSVDEIATCMERLWADDALCEELSEKGKQRAANWGPSQFRNRLLEIVASLTSGPVQA